MRFFRLFIPLSVLVVLALAGLSVYAQEDLSVVDDTAFADNMRPLPVFRHDEHNDAAGIEDCAECHHVYDENGQRMADESSEDQECSACHGAAEDGQFPMELVRRFHLNCQGCHQTEKAGPVVCGDCHKR